MSTLRSLGAEAIASLAMAATSVRSSAVRSELHHTPRSSASNANPDSSRSVAPSDGRYVLRDGRSRNIPQQDDFVRCELRR